MKEDVMQIGDRGVTLINSSEKYPEFVDRWAIVVGISHYQHQEMNLRFAHRDAEAFYALIQTPSGGAFAQDHIVKLADEEATTANITRALRSFLKKPASEDIVLIYFACHGAPDPDRPDIVYLLTHDTVPTDISGTALPMREIDLCLRENLLAERVILIADTCHSAAIGGKIGRRSVVNDSAEVLRYLREVSNTKPGLALLTSARANETSQEGEQWNGGHGVFTHYLLEGMRGAAAQDGVVRIGKLFDYVCDQVELATDNRQHPSIGPNSFDQRLPLAITAGVDARDHYRLGNGLFELGRLLCDNDLVRAAHAQLREAVRLRSLNQEAYPEAQLLQGQIEREQGNYSVAIRHMQRVVAKSPSFDAYFQLGLSYARQGSVTKALHAFDAALALNSEDTRQYWVAQYRTKLQSQLEGNFYVLMIGINFREKGPFPGHLRFLRRLLMTKYSVAKDNIWGLVNEQATYQGVLNAFAMLRDKVTPGDTVLVYYSGDSLPEHWESCLEFFDTSYPFRNEATNALSARDLHMFMDSLPTSRKTLAGVMPNGRLFSLAQERRRYALFTRASLGQQDWNYTFDDGVRTSVFVHSFFRHLSQETTTVEETTYGDVIASMQAEAKTTNLNQMPLFMGDPNRLLFSGTSTDLALFDILERTNYAVLPSSMIRREYDALEQMDIAFPEAYRSFGKAFLAKGAFSEALSALEKAQVQNPAEPSSVLDLALAHLGKNQIQPAINHLTHHLTKAEPSAIDGQIKQLCDDLRTWMKQTPIVLVGIDRYAADNLPTLQGAENDVLAMKQILIARYGYREEEITVLLNEDATHAAIMTAFAQVVEKAKATFGLFYFAGIGSETSDNRPTIVSHDGRQSGIYDIILTDLANQVASIHNRLLTIMDAGWTGQRNAPSSHRTIAADHRPPITERAFKLTKAAGETRKLAQLALPIGQVSIYNSSLDKYALESPLEQQFTEDLFTNNGENKARIHGSMTYQLLQRLAAAEPASFSFADFIARTPDQPTTVEGTSPSKVNSAQVPSHLTLSTSDKLHPHGNSWFVMPRLSDELLRTPVFADTNQHPFVERLDTLMRVDQTNEMVAILKRMIEQRQDSYPEGHFYLGVAHLVRKEYTEAIDALEKAITQQLGSFDAAHYYLGHTLFESEIDLARAESELRLATQQNDANTLAYYYLGQTIRKRIEQESLVEAQRALEIYLIRGAPLGMRNEVETFLQQGLENR